MKEKILKKQPTEYWNKLDLFVKICIIILVICLIELLLAIFTNRIDCIVTSILQIGLLVISYLFKRNIIKTKYSWLKNIVVIITILLSLLYTSLFYNNFIRPLKEQQIAWNELVLQNHLPSCPSNMGEVNYNSDEHLDLEISNISAKQFYDYVESCKAKGFVIDFLKDDFSYSAFSKDGYELKLYYSTYDKEMELVLNAPIKYSIFEWSESTLATMIPKPQSNTGRIYEDTEVNYEVIVSNITFDDYNNYITSCEEKGFNLQKEKKERSFYAKNSDYYRLNVEYIGNNNIKITVEQPEYDVTLKINFFENLIFSRYNVELYIDDSYEDTLTHGTDEVYYLKLIPGKHTITFENEDNDDVTGNIKVSITKTQTIELEISCYSTRIAVENKAINNTQNNTDNSNKDNQDSSVESNKDNNTNKDNNKNNETVEENKTTSVSYSTNDYDNAKKGNLGVFSYAKTGATYDIYYIIDFNEKSVYYFLDGDGNDWCDKLKIKSGDLNSTLLYTYHDGKLVWDEALYFKYKNQPSILIMEDGNHIKHEFSPTNLKKALKLRDTKSITQR